MKTLNLRTSRLPFCFGLALTLWNAHPICATTLTFSNTSDNGTGSLRQAIQNAAYGDTISFAVAGAITLTTGQLLITNDLVIIGPGAARLAISGNNNSRVFQISSNAIVSISTLTLRDGHALVPLLAKRPSVRTRIAFGLPSSDFRRRRLNEC